MKPNDFEQQVIADERAQKHAQEIKESRIGGLGGSDAAILMKIGKDGLGALTMTDNKRLAIMLGMAEQSDWSNAYTNAGHAFEDYAEKVLPLGGRYGREVRLEKQLARNFKTFAHADFVFDGDNVVECKFVQDTTATVLNRYYAQLQWYYVMGAKSVHLYHGSGTAEPFEVMSTETVPVERDETAIKILLAGVKALDEALESGWKPENVEKVAIEQTPAIVQRAFEALASVKAQETELKAKKDEATAVLKEYVEDWGISSIFTTGEIKHQVIYTRASVAMTFDAAKFLKEHPEFDRPEYYKRTKRAASITFK